MAKITVNISIHTYEQLKTLVGSAGDYHNGLNKADHAARAAAAATDLLEWAIRGLCGATRPAPFRYPLTIEARSKEPKHV